MVITLCFLLINKKITKLTFEDLDEFWWRLILIGTEKKKMRKKRKFKLTKKVFDKKEGDSYITILKYPDQLVVLSFDTDTQKFIRENLVRIKT